MNLLLYYISSLSLTLSPLCWNLKENQHRSYLCRFPLPQESEAPKWNLTHWWRKRLNSVAAPRLYERAKREKIESALLTPWLLYFAISMAITQGEKIERKRDKGKEKTKEPKRGEEVRWEKRGSEMYVISMAVSFC